MGLVVAECTVRETPLFSIVWPIVPTGAVEGEGGEVVTGALLADVVSGCVGVIFSEEHPVSISVLRVIAVRSRGRFFMFSKVNGERYATAR